MREERGTISQDVVVYEDYTLWGIIAGKVKVIDGGKLYVRGAVYGDLSVEDGGRAHIFGNISGNLIVHPGAKVVHSGTLGGDAINKGGRLFIDSFATVMGKVKALQGTTEVHPKAKVSGS